MNRMSRSIIHKFLTVCIVILAATALQAQGRLEVSAGAGLFEGIFIKAKYGSRVEIGLSQDLVSQLHTTGLEVYYRIPRKFEPAMPGPFYLMCGVSTTLLGKGYDTFEQSYIYPRIGRSFLFSRKPGRAGINIDLGITIHRHTNPPEGYITDIIPFSGSAGFFYRF